MSGLQEALHNAEQVRPHCVRGDGVDDRLAWWWMRGAVSISTRYLHKLFEADRRTVSLYLKGLRLDQARQDLLDPRRRP